jgi:DNA repair exonuclease SbcCD ATPase subunit
MIRTYKAFALLILIVIVGFFLLKSGFCSGEKPSDSTRTGSEMSLSQKLKTMQEGKAELAKINDELLYWGKKEEELDKERVERLRNGESIEDIKEKLEEARKKIMELKKRQETLADKLSGQE